MNIKTKLRLIRLAQEEADKAIKKVMSRLARY